MEVTGASGKSPNSSFSFRYNASNEELEELYSVCEDDPPAVDISQTTKPEGSPKKSEKSSIIDKYFKSAKIEKNLEKFEDDICKVQNDPKPINVYTPKDITCSPVKEYLHRFSRKHTVSEGLQDGKDKEKDGSNETWKLFHDFKSKFTQAVEDMKHRSNEDKEKSVPRDSSVSDSEENSIVKDSDLSVGDTDNQVSSLHSSLQNLSEITPPATAKEHCDKEKVPSDSTDDTHKNCESPDYTLDLQDDPSLDVESGVEALEDINIEGLIEPDKIDGPPQLPPTDSIYEPLKPPGTPVKSTPSQIKKKSYFCNFSMYFLSFILIVDYLFFPNALVWNGFCFGLWAYCFISNLFLWIVDTYFNDGDEKSFLQKRSSSDFQTYTIPSIKEHKPLEKFQGWINHYRYPDYDPFSYHINKTTSAFIKLEGCNLRLSYTKMKVPKRALWDEKIENPTFYQHRLYNLTGARVVLMPKGLVERRQWTKKYPICIILSDKEKIQVLEKESTPTERRLSESQTVEKKTKDNQTEVESTETNTSPERKRKFIWRRREKSTDKYENEPGREGLRQRIVRKIHKEKKSESVAPLPDPPETVMQEEFSEPDDLTFQDAEENTKFLIGKEEGDDDLDEGEMLRIKDFLEEAETEGCIDGTTEGEWSVHVKHTAAANHKYLYLFARTGREKHDWYRRFKSCIAETSKGSADSSTAEDKGSLTDSNQDKDEIELNTFRLSDKDVVSFKSSKADGQSDAVTIQSTSPPQILTESIEKLFWPYFFKIIQVKGSTSECTCRPLSPHVTWLNSMIARVAFDVMRDPQTIARLQYKIQRKLHTLKLPSFMSPLQVTKLSLEGACPLISRISPPTWDERGIWVDIDLRYEGGAYISILTQMNLMKLKEKGEKRDDLEDSTCGTENEFETESLLTNEPSNEILLMKRKPAIFQSDLEDSAESSSDDESPPVHPVDSNENVAVVDPQSSPIAESASSKKKFLRMVDRIATNKYFQTVTEYKYVKRAMEGLSNTDIKLQLDINGLEGTLAVNLPPPPHDRVWIGFRKNPQLLLKARPAFGARTLRIAHITNWIEQKLSKEFERILVLPNMEDIPVDVLTPTPVEFE